MGVTLALTYYNICKADQYSTTARRESTLGEKENKHDALVVMNWRQISQY